jgi:hypothetical protein
MPLYEIVLDAESDHELRLTDEPLAVGDFFQIGKRYWHVVRELQPSVRATARYQAERSRNERGEAQRQRGRVHKLRDRLDPQADRLCEEVARDDADDGLPAVEKATGSS